LFGKDWHGEAGLLQEAATREQLRFLTILFTAVALYQLEVKEKLLYFK